MQFPAFTGYEPQNHILQVTIMYFRLAKTSKHTSFHVFCFSTLGDSQFRSAQSGVTMVRGTPSSDSVMMDDNGIDWLHSNLTYQRQPTNVEQSAHKHGRHSFLPKSHISGCGVVIAGF